MRQYPRWVSKSKDDKRLVNTETEEIQAASEGYESHWSPEVIEKRKGTDREILRGEKADPVVELSPQQKAAITRKKNKELNG